MAVDPKAAPRLMLDKKNVLRLVLSVIVVGIVLFFLGRVLYTNWAQVQQYEWHFDLPLLLAASILLLGSFFVDIGVWWQTVTRMGERISYRRALRLYFAAGLAKYIPGSVWQFFGWFYLAQREGVGAIAAGTSVLICQAISMLAGVVVALAAFASLESSNVATQLAPLLILLPAALVVLQPRLIARVMNWGLTRLGRQPITLDLTFRDLATIFIFYIASYGLWGSALFVFTNSLTSLPLRHFIPFQGVFPASYALGLLAPFAPAGIGVREGVMTGLLSLFMPLPIATVIALLTRPWLMVIELAGAGLALISYARERRTRPAEPPAYKQRSAG